ncbi:MAG TPA: BrnT family toxin [Armatimonadota bacterium]
MEWDTDKATRNVAKHGVPFEEACTVFGDPLEVTVEDESHSEEEARFFSVGVSVSGRLLAVSYTERSDRVRILSARLASRREPKDYENQR